MQLSSLFSRSIQSDAAAGYARPGGLAHGWSRRLTSATAWLIGLALLAFVPSGGGAQAQGTTVLSANFNANAQGFTYADNAFYGTIESNYANGQWAASGGFGNTGRLEVSLGGINGNDITHMSGGWNGSFSLTATSHTTLTFRYRLRAATAFEADECQVVAVNLDGVVLQLNGNNYLYGACDGIDSGWQQATIDLGVLSSGTHSVVLGGYLGKKTDPDEFAHIDLDDVEVVASPVSSVLSADFVSNSGGFTYADDTFNGTSQPSYATGSWQSTSGYAGGGGLLVTLGAVNNNSILNMSGGWSKSFTLPERSDVTLSFRYRFFAADAFGADECQQLMAKIDSVVLQVGGNSYFHTDCDGQQNGTTDWRQVNLNIGPLSAGNHTIVLGGFANKKNASTERLDLFFDDVAIGSVTVLTANDVAITVDEDDGPQSFAYDADDFYNTPLTYSIVTQPADGTASDNGDGTFTFNPGGDFNDLDDGESRQVTFTYAANNGASTAEADVTVTVTGNGIAGTVDLPTGPFGASDIVGAVPGKFGVTASGTPSYSVPIAVPAGTAGMQPSLILQYDASGKPGIAGINWSIGGLAAVGRCPATKRHDNFIDPVDFDSNDKLCLNGERLVPVLGTYGANNTEYRTSYEGFTKVISYGTAGTGPQYLKAWRSSGEILEFGNTADSRMTKSGASDVYSWMLNRISDRSGNYITFTYFKDAVTGEQRLDRVDYTGNAGQSLSPYNHVQFVYEDRTDKAIAYIAGTPINQTKRLAAVEVYAEAQLFKEYQFDYEPDSAQLIALRECNAAEECLPDTVFTWQQEGQLTTPEMGFDKLTLGATEGSTGWDYEEYRPGITGDFNGDGLTDLYLYKSDQYSRAAGPSIGTGDKVWLSDGDGTFTTVNTNPGGGSLLTLAYNDYRPILGDFDGDGLTDMYWYLASENGRVIWNSGAPDKVWLSNGNGTFTVTNPSASGALLTTDYWNFVQVSGDFNADGLTDIYWYEADEYGGQNYDGSPDRVWLAQGDGTFSVVAGPGLLSFAYNDYRTVSGDFNADGLTDIYWYEAGQTVRAAGSGSGPDKVWLANGSGGFTVVNPSATGGLVNTGAYFAFLPVSGDYNGDGLTDIYWYRADQDRRVDGDNIQQDKVWLATGNGTFAVNNPTASGSFLAADDDDSQPIAGDFNGDGLSDLYWFESYGSSRIEGNTSNPQQPDQIWFAKGEGTFDEKTLTDSVTEGLDAYLIAAAGDLDKDGTTDLYVVKADAELRIEGSTSTDYVMFGRGKDPGQLMRIENGLGLATDIEYLSMLDPAVHTKSTGAVYPVYDLIPTSNIVSAVRADNGIGGQNRQTYHYTGLRAEVNRGSLGFAKMTVTDEGTDIVTESVYSQNHLNNTEGLLIESRTIAPDLTELEETTATWTVQTLTSADGSPHLWRYSPSATVTKRDLNGALLSTVTTEMELNDYGFPLEITETITGDGNTYTKITENVYGADNIANWILGRVTSATVTHSAPGTPNIVRTSAYTYSATTGQLLSETVEPGDPLFHTKTHTPNGFGVVTSTTETWGSTATDGVVATSRTTTTTPDAKGRRTVTETNPLSQGQTNTYHLLFGAANGTTGPNGLPTNYYFDRFGNTVAEVRADGTTTRTYRYLCDPSCPQAGPATAVMMTVTQTDGAPAKKVYHDQLYREVRTTAVALGGSESIVDTVYDSLGRVAQKSEPYFAGDTVNWTTITYDLLGRPVQTERPDDSVQTVDYFGLIQISTNELDQTKQIENDAFGRLIEVTDDDSNLTEYTYDAIGQLVSMSDPAGNVVTTSYDIRGNKIALSDPDRGSWTYRYNALGMLVEQTNALGQATAMTYDTLGRMLTRTDDATANPPGPTAIFEYDTATHGIGKIASVSSPGYEATTTYDSFGRPSTVTEIIDTTTYAVTTTYDSYSRPLDIVYPSGLTTRNVYNSYGHLEEMENPTTGAPYWEALDQDARGNITHFRFGNGVESFRSHDPETGRIQSAYAEASGGGVVQDLEFTFDALGNLTQRADSRQGLYENFVYDNLNRVIQSEALTGGDPQTTLLILPVAMWTGGGTTTTIDVSYDLQGNILSKTDIGTYAYGETHGSCLTGAAGPHAVSSVSGTKNAIYCYDANGQMLSGDGRTIVWSPGGQPISITEGTKEIEIAYGPERNRYKRIDTDATSTVTTHYVGGKLYEAIDRGTVVERKHYIGGFAVITEYVSTGVFEHAYFLTDHLGSIDTITDQTGAVIERMSFDAWGKRREVNWVPIPDPAGYSSLSTTRGYTGHEQLDPVGLVHMNGRVYDPEIGRFLSPDIVIEDAFNLQTWNAYTYVLNNPLSFTDPTGFFLGSLFKAIGNFFKAIFNAIGKVIKAIAKSPIFSAIVKILACAPMGPGAAVCVGVTAGLVLAAGGSVADALIAGTLAFVQADVGFNLWGKVSSVVSNITKTAESLFPVVKTLVHGVVGGALAVAAGGEFLPGFAGAAAGAIGGMVSQAFFGMPGTGGLTGFWGRTAVAAVAGGTGSKLAGGKFANGAVTAAFAQMYNAELTAVMRMILERVNGPAPYLRHQIGVTATIAKYKAEGYEILGTEVSVDIAGLPGVRVYDILVLDPSTGNTLGIEVKTTIIDKIFLDVSQVQADAVLVATQTGFAPRLNVAVDGVAYETYCFGCELAPEMRSIWMHETLDFLGIPFTHNRFSGPNE